MLTLPAGACLGDAAEYRLSDGRRSIIEFLKEQREALTPKAVSNLLGREYSAIKKLLWTMRRDGQLEVDEKGGYSVLGNGGNRGNCAANADGLGNPNGNPTSMNGKIAVTDQVR